MRKRNPKKSKWGYCSPLRWGQESVEYAVYFVRISKHFFICDNGNKAVRMLTTGKGLIPLQSTFCQYANVFRIDKQAKEEDLPVSFEDHVKHVEEVVAFFFLITNRKLWRGQESGIQMVRT